MLKLKLYNTLTRQKEDFVPLMDDPNYKWPKKDFVWIYSCWPTVYCHHIFEIWEQLLLQI